MKSSRKPIPPEARMVFKGRLFEVWQWEQKMFDGSVSIFERLKRPDTAIVLASAGDKILMQEEEQPDSVGPFVGIPSGRIEDGEDPLEGAKRELLEETGYESDDWQLLREDNPVGKIQWTIYTYIARNIQKTREPSLDPGEKISPKFVTFDEFLAFATESTFPEKHLIPILVAAHYDTAKKEQLRRLIFG